jgi:hypothetical protein
LTLFAAAGDAAEAPEWAVYRKNLKAMRVGKGTVGDALGAFLDHEFDLPLEFLRRAQVCRRSHVRFEKSWRCLVLHG